MLILTRKSLESLMIGGLPIGDPPIVVTIIEIADGRVTLGITAPESVKVDRLEIAQSKRTNATAGQDSSAEPLTETGPHVAS